MRRLMSAVALLWLLVGCSPSAGAAIDGRFDIGGYGLYIHCEGTGSPTVVIDVGVGDSYAGWQPLQDELAQDTRVCVYDRAAYGESDAGPMPRHSEQEAAELKQLLDKADVAGPHLLVGHSLGGLNLQVFASRYPDTIAGLVLLDPPPLGWLTGERPFPELRQLFQDQTDELRATAEAAAQSIDPKERAKADFYEAVALEQAALLGESAAQAAAIESFRDLPLVVIASGQPNPAFGDSAEAFQQVWIEESRALASKSSRGSFMLIEESGHQLHVDAPDRVMEAIRRMLD